MKRIILMISIVMFLGMFLILCGEVYAVNEEQL